MDEDHSHVNRTIGGGVGTTATTPAVSPDKTNADAFDAPSPTSGGLPSPQGLGASPLFSAVTKRPSFVGDAGSDAGGASPALGGRRSLGGLAGARGEGGAALAGTVGEGGGGRAGEMTCVDSVDLAGVVDVRQEESAPEQASRTQ